VATSGDRVLPDERAREKMERGGALVAALCNLGHEKLQIAADLLSGGEGSEDGIDRVFAEVGEHLSALASFLEAEG